MEYVTSEEKEGKRIYSITVGGKKYLEENGEIVSRLEAGQEYAGKVGQFSFMRDLRDIQDMLMINAEYIDEAKMKRIQSTLTDTKRKVAAIVFG
jgi:DNA-binding PadR family transcriptional regulator